MELSPTTPAQERFAAEVLAWGAPRPPAGEDLVAGLRTRLEQTLERRRPGIDELADRQRDGRVVVGRTTLERTVCDGWQLEPEPYRHTRDNVRAHLAVAAVVRDWERQRRTPPRSVVAEVWQEEASRRPGDPSSRSAWLNACDDPDGLSDEVAELVGVTRQVWPVLPTDRVELRLQRPLAVTLAGGRVVLRGTPHVVVDSPVRDDRARALVVDLRTGMPRPASDRRAVRFDALLVALTDGRAPFRWASFHVTDGRAEHEDLAAGPLHAVADEVMAAVDQLLRLSPLEPGAHDAQLELQGGPWCGGCRRRLRCPVAVD